MKNAKYNLMYDKYCDEVTKSTKEFRDKWV